MKNIKLLYMIGSTNSNDYDPFTTYVGAGQNLI